MKPDKEKNKLSKNIAQSEKESKPSGQTLTKEFRFKLTREELADRASSMANLSGEAIEQEQQLATISATKRQRIRELYDALEKTAAAVRDGHETRMCEAVMTKDLAGGIVQFWTKDPKGKYGLLEERAMTNEERQGDLPIEAPYPDQAKRRQRPPRAGQVAQLGQVDDEIGSVIKAETGKRTKRSSVDGAYNIGALHD